MHNDPLPDGLPLCDAAGSRDVMCSRKSSGSTQPGEECTTVDSPRLRRTWRHPSQLSAEAAQAFREWKWGAVAVVRDVAESLGYVIKRVYEAKSSGTLYVKLKRSGTTAVCVRLSDHRGECNPPRQLSIIQTRARRLEELAAWLVELRES